MRPFSETRVSPRRKTRENEDTSAEVRLFVLNQVALPVICGIPHLRMFQTETMNRYTSFDSYIKSPCSPGLRAWRWGRSYVDTLGAWGNWAVHSLTLALFIEASGSTDRCPRPLILSFVFRGAVLDLPFRASVRCSRALEAIRIRCGVVFCSSVLDIGFLTDENSTQA